MHHNNGQNDRKQTTRYGLSFQQCNISQQLGTVVGKTSELVHYWFCRFVGGLNPTKDQKTEDQQS